MQCNSIVGTYSGTVSYSDDTTGVWHCQIEWNGTVDLQWSLNEAISKLNTANISNDTEWSTTWSHVISGLPIVSSFSWTSTPAGAVKTITDAVHHLNLLITYDDGTSYPVSITYDNDSENDHLEDYTSPVEPDNSTAVVSMLQEMLALVSDSGSPVMA